ncbi:hypothetical protein [Paraburkholderia sp. SG-MS1]|uniref:hypothetical protein n=1 Tax=Paraburkholderia sp. SG-MS1 TaxID=2023741 RepID=UPI001446A300|nr:hypothetical protein [Paraburkholderia sp. SG-MS1]
MHAHEFCLNVLRITSNDYLPLNAFDEADGSVILDLLTYEDASLIREGMLRHVARDRHARPDADLAAYAHPQGTRSVRARPGIE